MQHLIQFCNDQIEILEDSIRAYQRWIAVLFVAAGVIIAFGLRDGKDKSGSELIKLGAGIAAAALVALPYKEIPPRRRQIVSIKLLRQNLAGLESLPPEERTRIMGLVDDLIKSNW